MTDEPATEQPEEERAPGTGLAKTTEKAQQIAAIETGELGYILPKTIDEAYRYAQAVVSANMAPNSYKNDPSAIMIGLNMAMEAGLPPLYGLRQIAVINGRPVIWGDGAWALVQRSGKLRDHKVQEIGTSFDPTAGREDWPDDFGYRVELYRKGQESPYVGEFTIADAKRAKLWTKSNSPWFAYPKRMLRIRAMAFPLRDGFADCLAGLAIREEVEDHEEPQRGKVDDSFLDDEPETEAPAIEHQPEEEPEPDAEQVEQSEPANDGLSLFERQQERIRSATEAAE